MGAHCVRPCLRCLALARHIPHFSYTCLGLLGCSELDSHILTSSRCRAVVSTKLTFSSPLLCGMGWSGVEASLIMAANLNNQLEWHVISPCWAVVHYSGYQPHRLSWPLGLTPILQCIMQLIAWNQLAPLHAFFLVSTLALKSLLAYYVLLSCPTPLYARHSSSIFLHPL